VSLLRTWLEEKADRGVTQVRVSTVLEKLDESELDALQNRRAATGRADGRVTITPDDLVGVAEIAKILNVDRARPPKWVLKKTTFGPDKIRFPAPYRKLATGPVWLRSQIVPLIPLVEERRRK
jgi:hypothetical protein